MSDEQSSPRSGQQSTGNTSDTSSANTERWEHDAQDSPPRPIPNKARKSFPRSGQQSRGNVSDGSSSNTERQKEDAQDSSTRSRENESDSSSSNTKREEKIVRRRSPRFDTKQPKHDAGSSTAHPVPQEAVESNKNPGEESRRYGSRRSSLLTGQRTTDAGSSSERSRRSRSSPPSTQQQENASGSSSTQQTGNKTMSFVQQLKRDVSQSSEASRKRQKLDEGSSSSHSTLPQNSSASTEEQKQDAGSSSAEPARNTARKSFQRPVELPRENASPKSSPIKQRHDASTSSSRYTDDIYISGRYITIVRSSTSEYTTPAFSDSWTSPERPQRDEGGDQSKSSQTSSANTDQLKHAASSSSETPMPSTSSSISTGQQMHVASSSSETVMPSTSLSASRKYHGDPSPPDESSSSDEPSQSRSPHGSRKQRREPEDPRSPPRSMGSLPNEDFDFIPSLPPGIREMIFSFLEIEKLQTCLTVCKRWKSVILSLKEPWKVRGRRKGFVFNSGEEELTPLWCRNFYFTMSRRLLSLASSRGLEIENVGCRYRHSCDAYDYYLTIKAFHYFSNEFVIASELKHIRVFTMKYYRPQRIAKIRSIPGDFHVSDVLSVKLTKIDGRTCVVCLLRDCRLRIWDIQDPNMKQEDKPGRNLKIRLSYNRGKTVKELWLDRDRYGKDNPECFDLLQGSRLLVATGRKGLVEIFNVYGNVEDGTNRIVAEEVVNVQTDPNKYIWKVMLARDYSPEYHSGLNEAKTKAERGEPTHDNSTEEPMKLFLFSLSVDRVYLHKVKIYLNANGILFPDQRAEATSIEIIDLNPAPDRPIHNAQMFCYRPTLCFDGTTYLYFPDTSFEKRTNIIRKYNVQRREYDDDIMTDGLVDQLLGVGNNYLALTTRNIDSTDVKLRIRNRITGSEIVCCTLPSVRFDGAKDYEMSYKQASSVIGERNWLDGLDGKNDNGVLCCYQAGRHKLKYVKWIRRKL